MEYQIKDVVTLNDDTKYMVMSEAVEQDKRYIFLINIDNNKDYKICSVENGKLFEVKDENLISNIAPTLYKKLIQEIENI